MVNREYYENVVKEKISKKSQDIMLKQIDNYYEIKNSNISLKNNYQIGDKVLLKKGTLLHGTYKNLDGLKEICKDGLISSWFIDGRLSKYPSSVGVWNLKKDFYLEDYINEYSGGTIKYTSLLVNNEYSQKSSSEIVNYKNMQNINDYIKNNPCRMWYMEQTKEARFMPSLVQNVVQIGIIFNGDLSKKLLNGDILNPDNISDEQVVEFVNKEYAERFVLDRKNKDDFFTDRESAILFGIPSNLIEGVLVGREYEKDNNVLNEIKELLPNSYICNLDGKVILN